MNRPNKAMKCVTVGEASTGGGRDVLYLNVWRQLSIGFMDPVEHPRPSPQRPAAGRRASLCLPFVMRCHLALLAEWSLLSSPCDTHHEYDNTVSTFHLLIGWSQTPPAHIRMHSSLLLALRF